MKTLSAIITILTICISPLFLSAQHIDAEGDIKLDNTLLLFDRSSGTPMQVGQLQALFPLNANSTNSPSLTLSTSTNPISSNGFADILLSSSDYIYFQTNGSTHMSVTPNGRVGIGTTNPSRLLQVAGDVSIGGGTTDHNGASEVLQIASQSEYWYVGALNHASTGANDFFIGQTSGGDGIFHINADNRWVGINTNAPTQTLHVKGDVIVGGGSDEHDNISEALIIEAESQSFHLAVGNVGGNHYDNDFYISTVNAPDGTFHIEDTGNRNVGIGTSQPQAQLNVVSNSDVTAQSGGIIQAGPLSGINLGIDGNEIQARSNFDASTLSIQREGGDLLLCNQENGRVGIGILSSNGLPTNTEYLLAVDGRVACEEVLVDMSQDWPDYVFKKDYELTSLSDLEQQIEKLGHLPKMPSAAHIEEHGLTLGEMQRTLVEKIEELTLYIIDLDKRNKALQGQVDQLNK